MVVLAREILDGLPDEQRALDFGETMLAMATGRVGPVRGAANLAASRHRGH